MDTLYPEIDHVEVKENDFAAALQTDASKKSFVIVDGEEELQAIMQEPLEKWRIFLHPTQRKVVGKKFNGPARVLGGALPSVVVAIPLLISSVKKSKAFFQFPAWRTKSRL